MSLKEYNGLQVLIIKKIGTTVFFDENIKIYEIIRKYREESFFQACKHSIKELKMINISI